MRFEKGSILDTSKNQIRFVAATHSFCDHLTLIVGSQRNMGFSQCIPTLQSRGNQKIWFDFVFPAVEEKTYMRNLECWG